MRKLLLLLIYNSLIYPQSIGSDSYRMLDIHGIQNDTNLIKIIGENVPGYSWNIKIDSLSSNVDDYPPHYSVYSISIYDSLGNDIQKIIDTTKIPIWWAEVKYYDVNFDSYLDLFYTIDIDMKGNYGYKFWLYDSLAKKYQYNKEFSSKFYSATEIYQNSKVLINNTYFWNSGNSYSYYYRICKNKPVLFKKSSEERMSMTDTFRIRIEELLKGKMEITKDSIYVR